MGDALTPRSQSSSHAAEAVLSFLSVSRYAKVPMDGTRSGGGGETGELKRNVSVVPIFP